MDVGTRSVIAFVCDKKACSQCAMGLCYHTTDIQHAKNFALLSEFVGSDGVLERRYIEVDDETDVPFNNEATEVPMVSGTQDQEE